MSRKPDSESDRLDDAARAGWLYYIAGNTQDEIARKLGVSRQTAQRLVSLAVSEKLIKVRLDHPIGRRIELSGRLQEAYGLRMCEVVPADPASTSDTLGVAEAAAAELERYLISQHPVICAMGTGRMLRAMVEQKAVRVVSVHNFCPVPIGAPRGHPELFTFADPDDRVRAPEFPAPGGGLPERPVLDDRRDDRPLRAALHLHRVEHPPEGLRLPVRAPRRIAAAFAAAQLGLDTIREPVVGKSSFLNRHVAQGESATLTR